MILNNSPRLFLFLSSSKILSFSKRFYPDFPPGVMAAKRLLPFYKRTISGLHLLSNSPLLLTNNGPRLIHVLNNNKPHTPRLKTKHSIISELYTNNIWVGKKNKISNLSGLLQFDSNFNNESVIYQQEMKKLIILTYLKVLFVLGKYKMHSMDNLIKDFDKMFSSILPILFSLKNSNKLHKRYHGILQHVLVAIIKNKEVPLDLLKIYTKHKVNFDLHEKGNILLMIETYILCKTLSDVFDEIEFFAINPESKKLREIGFDLAESESKTKQKYCDWFGKQKIINEITYQKHFKDSKMYESGSMTGRLVIKDGLSFNRILCTEYLTKLSTTLQKVLKNSALSKEQTKQLKELQLIIEKKWHDIKVIFNNNNINSNTQIINPKIAEQIAIILVSVNYNLKEYMLNSKLNQVINFGITTSNDNIDYEFIDFYNKENVKAMLDDVLKYNFEVLFNSTFDKNAHKEQLLALLEFFERNLQMDINNALEFFEN